MFNKSALLIPIIFLFSVQGLFATVIPVTDRNILAGLSPYNWVRKDGSWTVNGGQVRTHQLMAGEKSILLSPDVQDPVIDLYIKGMSPFEDRYNDDLPPNSVKFSGFIVDEGGSTVKIKLPRKVWLTIGDSILSGDGAALADGQGRPADDLWAASDEARASYGYLLAKHFGYRESRLAFGGYDWGGGMAGMPSLNVLIDSATSTVSRLQGDKLIPAPGVVLINLGENGAPAKEHVISALTKLRSRATKEAKIIVMIPVSGCARARVTEAFNDYQSSSGDGCIYLVDLGFFGFETGDGQHPTAAGHETVYKAALPAFEAIMQGKYISPVTIPLWTGLVPESDGRPAGEKPFITVYQPANPNGAAVVICPGGGYGGLVTGPEGHGIAQWLCRHGIAGIILEYRLPHGNYKVPLADVQRAMRLVRANAADWKLDPSRIGIIGFSAGGHLASTAATHFDTGDNQADDPVSRISSRPDFAMLIYPVTTMGPKTHDGSKKNLLGPDPSEELVSMFSNEKQVTR
ncbi:MAG: alpha/beta hydrolase fold domain-containing protein, partial [Bacteroidia bacterium]|nr:alpha/beta hydrolase fold domain-containing protein [Bacteroidia bacterium]